MQAGVLARGFSRTSSSMSMNLKISTGRSQRLLKIVVEQGELAHGIVEAEHGGDECDEDARRHFDGERSGRGPAAAAARCRSMPKISISGELMAAAATERRLARNSRRAACRKRAISHVLHVEGFHDAVAGDGFVQDVLDLGQLVLPAGAWCCAPGVPILRDE